MTIMQLDLKGFFLLDRPNIHAHKPDQSQLEQAHQHLADDSFVQRLFEKELPRLCKSNFTSNKDGINTELTDLFNQTALWPADTSATLHVLIMKAHSIFSKYDLSDSQVQSFLAILPADIRGFLRIILQHTTDFLIASVEQSGTYAARIHLLLDYQQLTVVITEQLNAHLSGKEVPFTMECRFSIDQSGRVAINNWKIEAKDKYLLDSLAQINFEIKQRQDQQKETDRLRHRFYWTLFHQPSSPASTSNASSKSNSTMMQLRMPSSHIPTVTG